MSVEDVWRYDYEEVECSEGSLVSTRVTFEDGSVSPGAFAKHPSTPTTIIYRSAAGSGDNTCSCISIDIENNGKNAATYLGHSGILHAVNTSVGDPNTFLTGCSDGIARLRRDSGLSVGLIHPDGHPLAFTGGHRKEQVLLWDIRAQQHVYELGTGNNAIQDLAWDSRHNSLYALSECIYMDRLGGYHGYRRARIPRSDPPDGMDEDEDEDEMKMRTMNGMTARDRIGRNGHSTMRIISTTAMTSGVI
ncbi:SubName: Full=Uncharacterized protein {ECO:0000313/EMBL:CCA76996.1} [Serendipita indica DSM 11827]|nr:SubName: Full=Uncharacterized protein {ECO:0000313/EMBL:CCA76996.1} [Serendipita indica DSM 11827]